MDTLFEIVKWGVLLVVGFTVLASTVRIVGQQDALVIETLGRYSKTLYAGLNFTIPLIQVAAANVSLQIRQINTRVDLKTKDNMFVAMPIGIIMHVDPDRVADAFYKLRDPDESLSTWVLSELRSKCATMKLAELFEDRSMIANHIKEKLAERLLEYGYVLVDVLVDQPTVPANVQDSFNKVIASEREKESAAFQAEAIRLRIVGEATAESEAQQLRATGLANARKILVEGLASSVEIASKQNISEKDVLVMLMETTRLDTIRSAAQHGSTVLLDVRSDVTPQFNLPVAKGAAV